MPHVSVISLAEDPDVATPGVKSRNLALIGEFDHRDPADPCGVGVAQTIGLLEPGTDRRQDLVTGVS